MRLDLVLVYFMLCRPSPQTFIRGAGLEETQSSSFWKRERSYLQLAREEVEGKARSPCARGEVGAGPQRFGYPSSEPYGQVRFHLC